MVRAQPDDDGYGVRRGARRRGRRLIFAGTPRTLSALSDSPSGPVPTPTTMALRPYPVTRARLTSFPIASPRAAAGTGAC